MKLPLVTALAALAALAAFAVITGPIATAHAQPAPAPTTTPATDEVPSPPPPEDDLHVARAQYERGELAAARDSLLRAYQLAPRPAILFALGQVELRIGRADAAIDYYERFIATDPGADQVSLAQQAIGAARMQHSAATAATTASPPAPAPTRTPPRWDSNGTRIVVFGGLALATGAGLIVHARQLAADDRGTFTDYEARIDRARTRRWIGLGVAAAGALTITAALVRWRMSGGLEVAATTTTGGATVSLAGPW